MGGLVLPGFGDVIARHNLPGRPVFDVDYVYDASGYLINKFYSFSLNREKGVVGN